MEQTRSALEELSHDDSSRKRFLRMVGGAGAAGALAIFMAACGDDDDKEGGAQSGGDGSAAKSGGTSDAEIVNYALTLEFLEADFYQQVLDSGEITDPKIVEAAKLIAQNEQEHVDALMATAKQLGGEVAKKPQTKFDDVLAGGQKKILQTAAEVENLGAAAYLGQADKISDPKVLAAALSIHSVEGRHAAVLNDLVGEPFLPDGAFAKPVSMAEVLRQVKPFIAA